MNERTNRKKRALGLTEKILIGLAAGALTGILIHEFMPEGYLRDTVIVAGLFQFIGQGFLRLMQMLVVPLVFFSLVTGSMSIGDTQRLGKIGVKTLGLYLITTAIAITIALTVANVINPGIGMHLSLADIKAPEIATAPSALETILNIIPTMGFKGMAEGNMLQVILFSLILGVILAHMGDKSATFDRFMNEGNDIMMVMTSGVMALAPYGVFCLIARTFSTIGFDAFVPMLKYMGSVFLGLGLQVILTYFVLLFVLARLNPLHFLKRIVPIISFAFSTASSGATIPISIQTLENMGVSKRITSFTVPLGATINMDGTAIMQGCAVVFVAQAYGIPLDMHDFLVVIATATMASIGTASIPSVGLITLAMVFNSVGLPVEGIAMIMGIDRLLDMARTSVNVIGDAVVSAICARQENQMDMDRFYNRTPMRDVETEI